MGELEKLVYLGMKDELENFANEMFGFKRKTTRACSGLIIDCGIFVKGTMLASKSIFIEMPIGPFA